MPNKDLALGTRLYLQKTCFKTCVEGSLSFKLYMICMILAVQDYLGTSRYWFIETKDFTNKKGSGIMANSIFPNVTF